MSAQTVETFAGLGLFLVGLGLLSEAVRTLAARRVRAVLSKLGQMPASSIVTGTMLGVVTQSTSAATYVCIGLLNSRAIGFGAALTISAWSGVGTSVLVFLASIDLRFAALFAISLVALLHLTSLQKSGFGRPTSALLLAVGVTLLGLAMLKESGQALEHNPWVEEFFVFSSESWIYGFLIGLSVTLVMQSSSTVSILAVAMSAANLIPLVDAVVLVCGSNLGSGLSVAMSASHLKGKARHLAVWQAMVKGLGSLAVLVPMLVIAASGKWGTAGVAGLSVPVSIAITFLLLNALGAALAGIFQTPLLHLLDRVAPFDPDTQQYEPAYIIDESAEDPETGLMLARKEQARLIGLLPKVLAPLRADGEDDPLQFSNAERRELGVNLTQRVASFVSEVVNRHPNNPDLGGLLLVQRCNSHIEPLLNALHDFVDELGSLNQATARENATSGAMTESLHLLLILAADQAGGEADLGEMLREMTSDRSEVMNRFRNEIAVQSAGSGTNRESMFVAATLFERIVWLIGQVSSDLVDIGRETSSADA